MTDWTPSLSGSEDARGITTTSSNNICRMVINTGHPVIGSVVSTWTIQWAKGISGSPASGTWQVKHYSSGGTLHNTANTTATPPASGTTNQIFSNTGDTTDVAANDYFTLSCLETDDSQRNPQISTFPTITPTSDGLLYTSTRQTDGADMQYLSCTITYASAPPPSEGGVLLPPEPAMVRL